MNTPSVSPARSARPLSLVVLSIGVASLLNALLLGCGGQGESTSQGSSTETPPPATSAASGDAGGDTLMAAIAAGKEIYMQRCALCHGKEGKGDGPGAAGLNPKPRNHTDGKYMDSRDNADLFDVIENGKGQMPAWGKSGVLTKEQIRQVLIYTRTLAVPKYAGPMP